MGPHSRERIHTADHGIERKRLVAERDHALQRATKKEAQLSPDLSHELRNALACIHQFGSILVDGLAGELSGEQREYVGIMLENASKIRSALDRTVSGPPSPS